MSNFDNLLNQGKLTEIKIANWLKSLNFLIEDVSDIEYYKKIDVDLLLVSNEDKIGIEIKSDERQYETGNIFIELGMDRKSGWKKGWFYYCKADLIFYHDNKNNKGQILNWKKMQNELLSHKYNHNKFWNTFDNCYGWGILVPIKDAYKNNWIVREYELPIDK